MPCRGPEPGEPGYYQWYNDPSQLAALLCSACRMLTPEQVSSVAPLARWWGWHQEQDRIREEREAEIRRRADVLSAARAKLSPEERQALGL